IEFSIEQLNCEWTRDKCNQSHPVLRLEVSRGQELEMVGKSLTRWLRLVHCFMRFRTDALRNLVVTFVGILNGNRCLAGLVFSRVFTYVKNMVHVLVFSYFFLFFIH
ncbi:unnamed protein product, partial [Owenia fusiformis]